MRRRTGPPAATGATPLPGDTGSDTGEPAVSGSASIASLTTTNQATASELSTLRSQIADFSHGHGGSADIVDDLQLVVSELATNVILHTNRTEVTTTIRVDQSDERPDSPGQRWTIEMTGARDIPGLDDIGRPPPDQPAGRGLLVVRAIVDHIEIDRDKDTVVCTLTG